MLILTGNIPVSANPVLTNKQKLTTVKYQKLLVNANPVLTHQQADHHHYATGLWAFTYIVGTHVCQQLTGIDADEPALGDVVQASQAPTAAQHSSTKVNNRLSPFLRHFMQCFQAEGIQNLYSALQQKDQKQNPSIWGALIVFIKQQNPN